MYLHTRDFPEGVEQKLDVVKSLLSVPVKKLDYFGLYSFFLILIALFAFVQDYFDLHNTFVFVAFSIVPLLFWYDLKQSRKRTLLNLKVERIMAQIGCVMVSDGFVRFKDNGEVVSFEALCDFVSKKHLS